MPDLDDLLEDLKQTRDELRVKMHLASMEIQDEWKELEEKAEKFNAEARLSETGEELGKALGNVGQELKKGYGRIRDAIKKN